MEKATIVEIAVLLVIFFKTANGFFDAPLSGSTKVYPWTIHKTNYKVKDHLLRDHVITEFDSVRMLQLCARQCLTHDRCRSFNYFPAESRCELSNTTHVDAPDDLVKVIGAEYYLRSTFSIDKEALGGCGSRKCPSSGMCIEGCYGDKDSECVCFGDNSKTDKCEERGLPRWSEWSKWSPCTVSCGYGLHTRTRHCTDPGNNDAPLPDVNCGDTSEETRLCHVTPCPYWTLWSDWTNCSTHTTCGQGVKERYRNCTYEGKIGVDGNCMGSPVQETLCHAPKCYGFFRLVGEEGTYGEGRVEVYDDITNTWGQVCSHDWNFEDAVVACRQHGFPNVSEVLMDVSEGDVPFLLTNVQCEGHEWTIQQCTHGGWGNNTCDSGKAVGVACSVDGVWGTWSEWASCSVTCGNGTQLRYRNCSNPPAMRGGKDCEGISQEERGCFDFECAEWSAWGAWEECNVTCNGGLQRRERTCEGRVKDCVGSTEDWQTCNEEHCAIDGVWNEWMEWSACNVSCGGGQHVRSRTCVEPQYGGNYCEGLSIDIEECNTTPCPVDGAWKAWEDWHACHATCGSSFQFRSRVCKSPKYGGRDCVGLVTEKRACNENPCPVKNWGFQDLQHEVSFNVWGPWSGCNVTCGGGSQSRIRTCHIPFDQQVNVSLNCTGLFIEHRACNDEFCPVDGQWEEWGTWEECSKPCGGGIKTRRRHCSEAKYGGVNCVGDNTETALCNRQPCTVDGFWSNWSAWEECPVTCGGSNHTRNRTCTEPLHGGLKCNGSATEIRICNDNPCPVDGVWTEWSDWSTCTLTCGGGNQTRQRKCVGPFYGGEDCGGSDVDTQVCNSHNCPVDGVWEEWSLWETCSVTCGGGMQDRTRSCIGPFYGGNNCSGPENETRVCNENPCPIDGVWEPWSDWSECEVTCGGSIQMHVRECYGPFYGGANCTGPYVEERVCNDNPCPVDAVWQPWSSWGECSTSCGGGEQIRIRNCTPPLHGGDECTGPSEESRECNMHECPIDGVWYDWREWSECNVTCGGGFSYRNRSCNGPFYGGADCEGEDLQTKSCNEHNCPIDGVWTNWTEWTECEVTCGGSIQHRERNCTGPFYGGNDCAGNYTEQRPCNENPCPIDGVWHSWSDWSECSLTCGGGSQHRSRECYGPFHGGIKCQGNATSFQLCNEMPCPVDGEWNAWTKWGECNVTCGGGKQVRTRTCVKPKHGGRSCIGHDKESKACNTFACPVDGIWEKWSEWSECSLSCSGGTKNRTRVCNGPFDGGKDCVGEAHEIEKCNTHPCPVDGYWDEWTEWGECSVTCAGGQQLRFRLCNEPKYGGKECEGDVKETRGCNDYPCPVDGFWIQWSEWSPCNVSCGGGLQSRTRTCNGPFHGGKECVGDAMEIGRCNENPCPIDGKWLEWSNWSRCPVTCGGGVQTRKRFCKGPYFGGAGCVGDATQTQTCSDVNCPVDGIWSEWGSWSDCPVTCGGGSYIRNRTCIGPFYGGKPCSDEYVEKGACNVQLCPIPGDWMDWGEWGRCSVTCEGGWRVRKRMCDMNSYGDITAPCIGNSTQVGECNLHGCIVQNCADLVIKAADPVDNGYYGVDPDLDGPNPPFTVYCDFTRDPSGETVIHHDTEKRTLVRDYEGAGEYQRVIHYLNATLDQVGALVDISTHCEQFVKWECLQASINHPEKRLKLTYLVNRFEEQLDYFGGAPPNSGMCACGVTNTCAIPGTLCNCDANDKIWREDSGLITQLEDLPLAQFRAGDTGSINLDEEEEGYHTVGPLICSGYNSDYILFRK